MVYELLRDCFVLDDFVSGFNLFFGNMGAHCLRSCSIFGITFAFYILTFSIRKQFGSIHPIIIGEVIYCLVACTLVIQFRDNLVEHFNLH